MHDHPVTRTLAHSGYCDWDYHNMIDMRHAMNLDTMAHDSGVIMASIVEVVSSFKAVNQQAALFEFNVGSGRLMVCTLGLTSEDPAAVYLLRRCIHYLQQPSLEPAVNVPTETLRQWMNQGTQRQALTSTGQNLDERASVTKHA